MTNQLTAARPIYEIAREIRSDWRTIYFAAVPYLQAMADLDKMTDKFWADDAETVIRYFLANSSTWKGETARRIKAELNSMLKGK